MRGKKAVLWFVLSAVLYSCTIVKNDASDSEDEDSAYGFTIGTIDPKPYASEIWDSMVIPRIEEMAADFGVIKDGLENDQAKTSEQYGYRMSDRNFYNFAVKGTVKILSVDTSSASGSAGLDVAPYDGKEDCRLRIGPVLQGYALRDIQSGISPNNFVNQVDWAKLSTELNNKVKEKVLAGVDFNGKEGREAELLGVFTYEDGGGILITPVRLDFKD
jgi:predicted lipoprotein